MLEALRGISDMSWCTRSAQWRGDQGRRGPDNRTEKEAAQEVEATGLIVVMHRKLEWF
jgi:hypothetical protein